MAKFKRVIQSYLFTKVTEYFGNLVKNWDGEVKDNDMFDIVASCFDHDKAVELIRVAIDVNELEELNKDRYRRDRIDLSDGLAQVFQGLWNKDRYRDKCKIVLGEIVAMMLADAENKKPEKEPLARRFKELQALLKLDDLETDLLRLAYVNHQTCFCWPRRVDVREKALFYAMALDRSHAEVLKALSLKGRLMKLGLFDRDLDLNHNLLGFVDGTDSDAVGRHFYRKVTEETLPWEYFGTLASKDGELVKRILKAAGGNRCNILLYGMPGTGKSSFARALAKEAGREAFEVLQGDNGKGLKAEARMLGIRICNEQELGAESLMVIDEADELLRNSDMGSGPFGFSLGRGKTTEKGVTNTLLDEMQMPAIWISNAPAHVMDESVRRRFDYSIRFDALSSGQRLAIWRNVIEKEGLGKLIPERDVASYSSKYATSAGGITTVLGNVKRLAPKAEEVPALIAGLMKPHCELMGIRAGDRFLPAKDYSLSGLNIKGKVKPEDIVTSAKNYLDADFCAAGADRPRLNILLWGAAGTGKTEFVKYLGQALGRPVVVKKGSDILDMYVGGTEANIAAAFREAEAEHAILFFDEIDGLIQERTGATHTWEVSQVNELLQQMENFDGILVAATNLRENLDAASMRRFTFKLEFDFLDDEGKKVFFKKMFGSDLTPAEEDELCAIPNLAPGDFRTVRQAQYFLGKSVSNADRLEALREEVAVKKEARKSGKIGFAA